jgi:TetR/AcrR family transcriptional regulator, transcriptional repressor for nem operon
MPITKIQKEEILHRCWEVLHRQGYNGASISMLAEATGLGKAGLLHHFHSKEALMRAVLLYAVEQFRIYVLSVAGEDLPPEQRLEKLLRRQNRIAKLERKGCFFANTALETGRDGPFNEFLVSFFDEWQAVVSGLFSTVMPEAEARTAAYRLLLEYEGAVAFFKISGDAGHLEGLVQRAVNQFFTIKNTQAANLPA